MFVFGIPHTCKHNISAIYIRKHSGRTKGKWPLNPKVNYFEWSIKKKKKMDRNNVHDKEI